MRRRLFTITGLAFSAGCVVLFVWYLKRLPEQTLISTVERQISESKKHVVNGQTVTSSEPTRQELVYEKGRLDKARYYFQGTLVAVDLFDEVGELLRRDIMNPKTPDADKPRAELFYNGGRLFVVKILNEQGLVEASSLQYFPLGPWRTGY